MLMMEYHRVASATTPGVSWVVTVVDTWTVACTCPDFAFHAQPHTFHACKHMQQVQAAVESARKPRRVAS